ncbi:hypothetical protein ACFFLM_08875 [Deinococcus oregonensis]|uniref:Tyr recombinase domain-containing protein n=1 Tax=Deinococcus oregonensis TaxID=1805970 RepID=A0ABV6AX36_9DEIO
MTDIFGPTHSWTTSVVLNLGRGDMQSIRLDVVRLLAWPLEQGSIESSTLRSYSSEFRAQMQHQNLHTLKSIDMQDFIAVYKSCETKKRRSIVKYFYKVYISLLVDRGYLNLDIYLAHIVENPFISLTEISKLGFVLSKDLSENKKILMNHADLNVVEKVLCLPSNYLSKNIDVIAPGFIPVEWWPDDFKGRKNRNKMRHVNYILSSLSNKTSVVSQAQFDRAVENVRQGNYSNAFIAKAKDTKLEINYVRVQLDLYCEQQFTEMKKYKMWMSYDHPQPKQRWCLETAEMNYDFVCAYYTYIFNFYLKSGSLHFDERIKPSLTLLTDFDKFIQFIEFRAKLTGGYSQSAVKMLGNVMSYLSESQGWIYLNKYLLDDLPDNLKREVTRLGSWEAYCLHVRSKFLRYFKSQVEGNVIQLNNTKLRVIDLLKRKDPLNYVFKALDISRQDLLSRKQISKAYAMELQDHLLVLMSSCFPLRSKNWSLLTYDALNLQERHLSISSEGLWQLKIPVKEIKNGKTGKQFANCSEIVFKIGRLKRFRAHDDLIRVYFDELRPLLTGGSHLFVRADGISMNRGEISKAFLRWSQKYLSCESVFSSAVPGLRPFRSHAMRAIVGTHYCRRGEIAKAAALLMDSEDVVRRHYLDSDLNQILDQLIDDEADELEGDE